MAFNADKLYNKYKGQSLLVPGAKEVDRGQCVQWVDYALNDSQYGYGLPYVWADAIDWWNNFDSQPTLRNNFNKVTDGTVKKGDIIVFNEKTGSKYGHIDLAMKDGNTASFQGADSNWGGNKTVHLVQHNNASLVLGAIRPKEGIMTLRETIVADEVDNHLIFISALKRAPYEQEKTRYIGTTYGFAVDNIAQNADSIQGADGRGGIDTMAIAYYKNGSKIPKGDDPSVVVNGVDYAPVKK